MAGMRLNVTQLVWACSDEDFRRRLIEDPQASPPKFHSRDKLTKNGARRGSDFHALVDQFTKWLVDSPSAESLRSETELWQALHDQFAAHRLQTLAKAGKVEASINLSTALRTFCARLTELQQRIPSNQGWRALLAESEYVMQSIPFENGKIEVSGKIDALRLGANGGLELVDYKLNRGSRLDLDVLQLAIYASLLRRSPHALTVPAVLEYYEPELHLIQLTPIQLEQSFEQLVAPILREISAGSDHDFQTERENDHRRAIEACYDQFNLKVSVTGAQRGPQLVRYQLKPGPGVKVVSLVTRAPDIQMALGCAVQPSISPGPGHVNLDIPNDQPETVHWKALVDSIPTERWRSPLTFPVGMGIDGNPILVDLADSATCHLLVAGVSGSGKSEFLKAMVASMLSQNSPETLRLTLVDPKILTFAALRGSPYLDGSIITDTKDAAVALEKAVDLMEKRYKQLAKEGFENLSEKHKSGAQSEPFVVLIFDEFADLVLAGGPEKKTFENRVARIAGKGRAAGIHLVLATQRPDSKVVSGLIKSNLPCKVCMRVTNQTNSRIILDSNGGESLFGRGDLLCDRGKGGPERAQAPYLSQSELNELAM